MSCGNGASAVFEDFNLEIDSDSQVESVEVGIEYYSDGTDELQFEVTSDGGSSWETTHTATHRTSDDDTVEWIDVTSDANWNENTLNNTNFQLQVLYLYVSGAIEYTYLDWIPVRVTTSPDGGGNTAPSVDLVYPDTGATVSGNDISGTYVLTDPDNDPGTMTLEVSDDDGSTWDTEATVSGEVASVSSSASGETHTFTWDSELDLGNNTSTSIQLRARATDGTDTGNYFTTGSFTVENGDPPDPGGDGGDSLVRSPSSWGEVSNSLPSAVVSAF